MSKTTENIGLIKPELTDIADITATNANWDKLDKMLSDDPLLLNGSKQMTGSLKIKGLTEIDGAETLTYVKAIKDINNFRYLRIINPLLTDYTIAKVIQWGNVVNGSEKTYNLHGEHNKPGGSYIGNGSATTRTIDTGGIGYGLLIWSNLGWAIVSPSGFIGITANQSDMREDATFTGGKLTLNTSLAKINGNGVTFNYQVL